MLVKTMPSVVSRSWTLLREVIRRNSMPLAKLDNEKLDEIFQKLLSDRLTCWYGCDEDKIHTVILTELLEEPSTKTKNMLIFTISIIDKVQPDEYVSMLETLRRYAKANNCVNVFCYSANPKLTKMFETYGADTSYNLVKFEL